MLGLLAVLAAAYGVRLRARPQWVYVDQGASWVNRGLGFCGNHEGQSPVNFADAAAETALGIGQMTPAQERLWYNYPPVGVPLRLVNDGHTVGVTFPELYKAGVGVSGGQSSGEMLQDRNFFRLYKMTIHHPSEHKLHGKAFPLELQLIHQNPMTQKTGILAIWVELGEPSAFFTTLLEGGVPERTLDEVNFNLRASPITDARSSTSMGLSLASLLEESGVPGKVTEDGVFRYKGSLTEPPCEEGVEWWVRRTTVKASQQQINKLASLITKLDGPNGNTRMLQKAGGRPAEIMPVVDYQQILAAVKAGADDVNLPPPVAVHTDGVAAPGPEAVCSQLPEYEAESAFDSPEVIAAKREYAKVEQQATSTKIWVANAKSAMSASQGIYDGAAGAVAKINQKWDTIAKQSELETATAQMATAVAAAQAVCDKTLPIVCGASDSSECKEALGNLATTTTTAAPTAAVTTPPAVVDTGLDYTPKVVLPGGAAGNPFSPNHAETVSRIGGTGMAVAPRDLTNSLRQPLVPNVPIPQEAAEVTAAPTTQAPTVAPTTPPPMAASAATSAAQVG